MDVWLIRIVLIYFKIFQMINDIVNEFIQLESRIKKGQGRNPKDYHSVVSLNHRLMAELETLKLEYSNEELRLRLIEIRNIYSKSNFSRRLQLWPRGYQGDFETIEQICSETNSVENFNIEYYLEQFALSCPIAQQHRNKINIQAKNIVETITNKKNANILICACGSSYDLRVVQKIIENFDFRVSLNDLDMDALNFSQSKLNLKVLAKTNLIHSNVISLFKNLKKGNEKFDLVLFGGLFDYLTDKQISFVLKQANCHLNPNGKILFTNIAPNNPYKAWIETISNWELKDRSHTQNIGICEKSGISINDIKCYKDVTRLTNIVEVKPAYNKL